MVGRRDEVWPGLCEICPTDCGEDSKYSGYFGAMQGLVDGICEVAFVKHTTPEDWVNEFGPGNGITAEQFRFLCREGGCAEIRGSNPPPRCIEGEVPAHTMVVASNSIFREP